MNEAVEVIQSGVVLGDIQRLGYAGYGAQRFPTPCGRGSRMLLSPITSRARGRKLVIRLMTALTVSSLRTQRNFWFFDASNGFEEIPEWGGDQVDHGREGCGIAIAPGASSSRLEETVEALQSGVAVS